jgi:hypothetical protein
MIGSIASLLIGILFSAAPAATTCGHWLYAAFTAITPLGWK